MFPDEWILIATGDEKHTSSAKLGEWDSGKTNGLYILRLQVVDSEGVLSTAYAKSLLIICSE